jgi:hypothetical protein
MMCVSRHIERLGASNEIGPAVHPGEADLEAALDLKTGPTRTDAKGVLGEQLSRQSQGHDQLSG